MKNHYFFDSSAIFAWADASSEKGKLIHGFIEQNQPKLTLSNLIFAELISLVTKRVGKKAGLTLGKHLLASEHINIITVDAGLQTEAWNLYKKYKDKDFDLIDATSFIICKKRKIETVLTLDRHFVQMGFDVYPEISK